MRQRIASVLFLITLALSSTGVADTGPEEAASAAASVAYLANVMDQDHDRFPVSEDVSSAGNHFHAFAKIPDESAAVDINGSWTENSHSGATAIRCEFHDTDGFNFGGFYFQNGILPPGALKPEVNFGTVPNAGIDLSGATALTFWARGEHGGEAVEFFMGGVGRVAFSGVPTSPYPDSSPRQPPVGTVTTLSTEWRRLTIDLTGLDLSYVLGGFAWVANALDNPGGAVFYLDDIQYELSAARRDQRLNEPRFLRSFTTLPLQPDPFDGNKDDDIDFTLRNTAFTYDNALALLAFLADGSADSVRRARLIGDAFVYASHHDRFFEDGRIRTAYAAGDISLPPGWTPNGLLGTVPIPGFYDERQEFFFEVEQCTVDVGNNAWAMIALLALHQHTQVMDYLDTAGKLGEFIHSFRNDTGLYQGFQGGVDCPECPAQGAPPCPLPGPRAWASTEHNLDVYAAFTRMFEITGEDRWRADAQHAHDFVDAMEVQETACHLAGTTGPNSLNTDTCQLPLDTQSWSVLALRDRPTIPQALGCAEMNHVASSDGFTGFDFNNDRDGVWFEGTAQMAVAYALAGQQDDAKRLRALLHLAQQTSPFGDAQGLSAASHDAVSTGFQAPTGDDFKLFRRLHVGATAWNAFAQLQFDPYFQVTPTAATRVCQLDVDGSGPPADVATDIVYTARRLLGLVPVPSSFRVVDPTIPADAEIVAAVDTLYPLLDVDLNDHVDVATDLVYIVRCLLGLPAVPSSFRLTDPSVPSNDDICRRTQALCPAIPHQSPAVCPALTPTASPTETSGPAPSLTPSTTTTLTTIPTETPTGTPTPTQTPQGPWIAIPVVPAYGTSEDLNGMAGNVDPSAYRVAPYIYVQGWWTKPTFASPTVPILPDGTWTADITTGGCDIYSTRIVVFLIPATYTPPQMAGQGELPPALFAAAVASVELTRGPATRFVDFAGAQWAVKRFDCPAGPGPNRFSDRPEDVWVDGNGLHLTISKRDAQWYSTEVILQKRLGYGTYVFQTHGRLDIIDPCMVAGFFTWDNDAPPYYREIDTELSRWCNAGDANNAQYVIQPYASPGNRLRFRVDLTDQDSDLTHVMHWSPGAVAFATYRGHHDLAQLPPPANLIYTQTIESGDVPVPGNENVRINFWLDNGAAPLNGVPAEFVVTNFLHLPPSATSTPTSTAPPTSTDSPTPSFTSTPTATATRTATTTATASDTPTRTHTSTATMSATPTQSATSTSTPSATLTSTRTPTLTPTRTPTVTATSTFSPTPTVTSTPTIPGGPGTAAIELTFIPPYASSPPQIVEGRVLHVAPADYKVVVYIYIQTCTIGWWGPKPYWDFPLTTINPDGTWTTLITTGGCDAEATKIAAFLIPNGYDPPDIGNATDLPAELDANSVARVDATR
jgi:hypothetical protein